MKVLWIASEYFPRIGGIEEYVHTTTQLLAERCDVFLVTGVGQYLQQGARSKQVGALNLAYCTTTQEFQEVCEKLLAIVEMVRPTVIHFANAGLACFARILVGRAPLFCTVHGKDLTRPWQLFPNADSKNKIADGLGLCHKVIAVSEYTAAHVRRLCPTSCVEVVMHGVDFEKIKVSSRLFANGETPRILTVARLIPRKGHTLLLQAMTAMKNPFFWDVVGDGPLRPDFERQVALSGFSKFISIHGRVDREELSTLFERACFFALLPIEIQDEHGLDCEGFGLVYLEAAAYGKPSIASSQGGPAEAVHHNSTGLLVDPQNTRDVTQALDKLASNPILAGYLGNAARARVETHFSLNASVNKLRRCYSDTG